MKPPPKKRNAGQSTPPNPLRRSGGIPAADSVLAPKSGEVADEPLAPFAASRPSEHFDGFMTKILPKIRLGETSWQILDAFLDINLNAGKVGRVIKNNQYYEAQFLRSVRALVNAKEVTRLESALVLFGMQNSRNLVIALQALRSVRGNHVSWGKDGRPDVVPSERLRYALEAEELFISKKRGYADLAYAAGLVFDLLVLLAEEFSTERKRRIELIEKTYLHGLKCWRIARALAPLLNDIKYKKYIFSACLLHDIGDIMLALLDPDYFDFADACARNAGITPPLRYFAEERRFGVGHALLGGLVCEYLPIFDPLSQVIAYHHKPFLLKSRDPALFELASLVCLADNIADNFRRVDRLDDPILRTWKTPELRDFGIDMRGVVAAVSKLPV